MAYVFLLGEDCSITASRREVIMQREKCVSEIWFLVPPEYKSAENDMTLFSVVMEYILPSSRRYNVIDLVRDEEDYQDHLRYTLPINTDLSSENGDVEFQLTFIYVGLDADGKDIQKVRKTKTAKLHVTPVAAWSDIVPDSNLLAIDQRIIKTQAQINELGYYAQVIGENQVDDLKYDDVSETLQLMAGNKPVGNVVSVKEMIDDGIPVIDLDNVSADGSENPDNNQEHENGCNCGCEDNVVEFGYDEKENEGDVETIKPSDDDNVVEF